MNCHPFGRMTIGVLVFTAGSAFIAAAADKLGLDGNKGDIMCLSRVDSPRELATQINGLFSASPMGELDRLVSVPDGTVALASGWERVRRTMPEAKQEEVVSPDGHAISRFLGLVEGRVQIPIPEVWEATVKSAKAYSRRPIGFSYPKLLKRPTTEHLKRDGDQWIVKTGSQSIRVPVEDRLGPVDNAAVQFAGEMAYVALYGWPPIPYRLLAIDRGNGKVIWSSKVWGAGGLRDYEGQGWHVAEMRWAGETLAVFGISEGAAYIEVFDKKTGENRCRFSTAYFAAIAPRK